MTLDERIAARRTQIAKLEEYAEFERTYGFGAESQKALSRYLDQIHTLQKIVVGLETKGDA
jgi:hypothetical protein